MSTTSPTTLLGAVLLASAEEEEGGRRALARRIGISHQTLHELLTGARVPGRHVRRALASFLGISRDQIAAWAREPAEAAAHERPA